VNLLIRVEVEDLLGRYCDSVLRFDLDEFADAWCEDATWAIPGSGVVTGRDEIVATFAEIRGGYRRCLQQVLNGTVVPIDDDRAMAHWQVRELQWRRDGTGSELLGVYHDEVERSSGGWRFARRDFELLYDGPVSMPGRLRQPR